MFSFGSTTLSCPPFPPSPTPFSHRPTRRHHANIFRGRDPHHNDHLQTEHSKDGRRRAAAAITAAARVWPTNLILPADVYDELEGAMEDVPERLDYVFLGVGGRDGRLFAKKESRRKRLHLSPDRGRTSATVVAGYEVVGCRVVGGQPGQCVSDHSGVLAELSFPEPAV